MAVTVIMEFDEGRPEDYRRVNEELGIHGPGDEPEGLISHVCAIGAEGLVIVDTWESAEAAERFGQRLAPVLEKLDLESSSQPLCLETVNVLLGATSLAH